MINRSEADNEIEDILKKIKPIIDNRRTLYVIGALLRILTTICIIEKIKKLHFLKDCGDAYDHYKNIFDNNE
jgi:hypothetical protein